jgi:hypothetical protein
LTLSISDVGFTTGTGHPGFANTLGGVQTGAGSVSQTASYGVSDLYFDTSGVIGMVALSSTGGIKTLNGMVSGGGPVGPSPYSLTLTDVLTDAGTGKNSVTFSLDGEVAAVPEPGALILFGAGLIGCAIALRRRQHKSV